jgi:hypothetical protein
MRCTWSTGALRRALLALPLVLPLLGGCASSQLVNMWKDPSYSDGALKKVLVVAIRKDPVRRRIWEDTFSQELKAHGVTVVSSYTMFPSVAPDTQQVAEAVRNGGYDGVVISVRLPNVTQTTYVPGYTETKPISVFRPLFHGYVTYYRDVQVPGYTETNEVRSFQTDVWTTRNGGRLIWSGTIETVEAPSQGTTQDAIRKRIVPELVKTGLLPSEAK